jgi:hypothetical protein
MRVKRKEVELIEKEKNLAKVVDNLSNQLQFRDSKDNKKSESAEAIAELNKDGRSKDGMSEIDFKTDLSHNQAVKLARLDSLSRLGHYSEGDIEIITRTLQRKFVSLNRKGRREAIELHQEINRNKDEKGFWNKWFSPKE